MPLAPVIMVAVRVPDFAKSIIADHACSSVNWCKSKVACGGGVWRLCGMRVDKCNSDRTARRVAISSGVCSVPIICSMSRSVNCFMGVSVQIPIRVQYPPGRIQNALNSNRV